MKERLKQPAGEDLTGLSTEVLLRRYYSKLETMILGKIKASKELAKFQREEPKDSDDTKIMTEYTKLRLESSESFDLRSIDLVVCNKAGWADATNVVCAQIRQERDLNPTQLEYHILYGTLPTPKMIVDFLKRHPDVKEVPREPT